MAVGRLCRWDWLVETAAMMDGAAPVELPACERPVEHRVFLQRDIYGGGMTIRIDVDLCDVHEVEACAVDGYKGSVKKRVRQHIAKTT